MKPVTVSATVPNSREEVYDFLELLANHERFCDHFLVEWSFSGPRKGVGAHARFSANTTGSIKDWIDTEVIEAERPSRTVEEAVGAAGKRVTRGTYSLEALPGDAGTKISFELVWIKAPRSERVISPLIRSWTRRSNAKALTRLAGLLAKH
jgi:hypothetical protein